MVRVFQFLIRVQLPELFPPGSVFLFKNHNATSYKAIKERVKVLLIYAKAPDILDEWVASEIIQFISDKEIGTHCAAKLVGFLRAMKKNPVDNYIVQRAYDIQEAIETVRGEVNDCKFFDLLMEELSSYYVG